MSLWETILWMLSQDPECKLSIRFDPNKKHLILTLTKPGCGIDRMIAEMELRRANLPEYIITHHLQDMAEAINAI